ncbi:hypothetical protein STEG23_038231 [Scotinomys teguina]
MGIPKNELQNLANTLEGDKDLNSPRELSAEAEKELAIVEKTVREAHVDHVNPELKCILVTLPSRHSPTGILMEREDVILEWMFLPCKPNKKLKTYIEKISDFILKDASSGGPYGEPSLLWSPELSAVRVVPDQQDPVWVPERLVRRIPEDRKAEDVASMDDVGSAEPAVVYDIGPPVPPNGDRA